MKKFKNHLLPTLLILSFLCNILLCYYLYETSKPSSSIVRLGFSEHDTVIYCDKLKDIPNIKINTDKRIYTIGNTKLVSKADAPYLVTATEEINLSEYEGFGFVINSNGELLYSLNTPTKKQQTVFITPSGKKYHTKRYCAGKTSFEINIETAKLLRAPCSICA